MKKKLFERLSWLNDDGPFVTVVIPSTFKLQEINKDRLHFKNLMKDAEEMFNLKYPQRDFSNIKEYMEKVYEERDYWRGGAKALMFVFNNQQYDLIKLGVEVKPEVYVDDIPFIIPLIEDIQFMTHLYILALNRDSFRLYEYSFSSLIEVELGNDAPITMDKAIGEDYNTKGYPSGASRVVGGDNIGYYGGVGATRDEKAVDLVNYFQAIDRYLSDKIDFSLPLILYALPENRSVYMDITKLINLDENMAILASPKDFNLHHLQEAVTNGLDQKNQRKVQKLYDRLERYTGNDLVIKNSSIMMRNAKFGAIDTLLLAKERLDLQDYETNRIAKDVLDAGGEVYVLEVNRKLGPDKLTALLRYKV